jgi:hypothetical protein
MMMVQLVRYGSLILKEMLFGMPEIVILNPYEPVIEFQATC